MFSDPTVGIESIYNINKMKLQNSMKLFGGGCYTKPCNDLI